MKHFCIILILDCFFTIDQQWTIIIADNSTKYYYIKYKKSEYNVYYAPIGTVSFTARRFPSQTGSMPYNDV